ncbi:MAG: rubredoxin-like domain-containing protein [Candidatus Dojkabacteria bacterium]|jgi:rubrerythrin
MDDILQNSSGVQSGTGDPTEHVDPNPTDTVVMDDEYNPEDLDDRWLRWKCLSCGYLYEGVKELKKCPRCGNENPDLFEDAA